MGTVGKYQVYYNKIMSELLEIKNDNSYMNASKAFAHWYLEKTESMDSQEIAESIIDGDGDNGVDAIIFRDNTLILYQFKMPDKVSNIEKKIDEKTALKVINGYNKLTSNRKPTKANNNFLNYRQIVKESNIFSYKMIFVVFHDGLSEQALDAINTSNESIIELTGNSIKIEVIGKKQISDLYDRLQRKAKVNIELKYNSFTAGYNIAEKANSHVGFVNAKNLVESCTPVLNEIFDENIRLYEGANNPVNIGIKETATGEESNLFYFYHNGVVLICDHLRNSTGNQNLFLEGASVVNGCQTINTLKLASDEGNLKDDVFLQIRVIETTDFDFRAKITEYLNSQTKIKDSYFLANNTFIRDLQNSLLCKGYFLERMINEYSYKLSLNKISEYPKDKVLALEKIIQVYAGYFSNEHAARAKRGKGELFDKEIIDTIIDNISAEKVLEAYNCYNEIQKVTTNYRKCRRSDYTNRSFLDYLGIQCEDDVEVKLKMNNLLFMHTADILLLNTVQNLKSKGITDSIEGYIKSAIKICQRVIEFENMQHFNATKNSLIFSKVQKFISWFQTDKSSTLSLTSYIQTTEIPD